MEVIVLKKVCMLNFLQILERVRTSRLRTGAARSRDCALVPRNLEIGTQFRDSENVQHGLDIAQIPRLHGTYTLNWTLPEVISHAQNLPTSIEVING